jgi:hypothetical protein
MSLTQPVCPSLYQRATAIRKRQAAVFRTDQFLTILSDSEAVEERHKMLH